MSYANISEVEKKNPRTKIKKLQEPIMGKTFIVEVIYVLALEYQLTLYCWFGNELTLAVRFQF